MKPELKKLLILNAPYLLFVYLFDKIGQAVRLSPGTDLSGKVLSLADGFSAAFTNPLPSLAPMDLLIGIVGAVLIRLALYEERQLYTVDKYFQDEEAEPSYQMAGKEITPKLLLEAIRALPEERRKIVLMYYFEGLTDVEIGKQLNISRSTVQYRRTSSFEQLKKYLEENADEWIEW